MENTKEKLRLLKVGYALIIILCVYFGVKALSELKSYSMLGSSDAHTITLTGHGEIQAVPDIATVSLTISKDAKTAKEAQDAVAVIEKKALDVVRADGVVDKDIKTADAAVYPKYEYKYDKILVPCTPGYACPPQTGNSVITGYTASESITVKVRNIDDAGKIMKDLGTAGVSNLSGPSYTIDNEDGLKVEARKEAIEDARTKAEALAKDLGVRLGRISSFNESGNYYPMYYAKDAVMNAGVGSAPAPAELPKGENTVSSDVTITYEIK